ncbi:MAG: hypothetical protein LDL12_01200 [Anaerolinea sp.]|nr:hypothetical protein [Anaerolinea sp.]
MSWLAFDGLLWFLGCLAAFVVAQRRLHRELQAVFLLLTRHPAVTVGVFSLLLFPGVLLHELSHYLMARLLGVRTGRFSLLPAVLADGTVRLGYVETAQVDFGRDALIGMAPLLTGGALTAYLGIERLGFLQLAESFSRGGLSGFWQGLVALPQQSDFWLWFYLTLAISSTMLPSASDRRGWLPLGLTVGGLVALAVVAGAGPWMLENLAPGLNQLLRALAVVLAISLVVHGVLLVPVWALRRLIERLTGMRVQGL